MMNCQVGDYELWSLSFLYEWISSEIQQFTFPGLFWNSLYKYTYEKCTKNLNYTASARIFFCQVRRSIRSFVQLLFQSHNSTRYSFRLPRTWYLITAGLFTFSEIIIRLLLSIRFFMSIDNLSTWTLPEFHFTISLI